MRQKLLNFSTGALLIAALLMASLGQAEADGSQLYAESCAACHGEKGKGDGPASAGLNPRPEDFHKSLADRSDDWVAKVITGGGPAVGMAPGMPAFDGAFSADQTHQLINYLRTLAGTR